MIKQIKPGDKLKYFWYKNVRMEPLKTTSNSLYCILILATLLFPCHILIVLDCIASILVPAVHLAAQYKRLNDYLIMVRYPFNPYFYLYQSIRKGCCLPADYREARTAYLTQMQLVLEQLPPGRYRTVTQPMFTRAILRLPWIKVVRREKAYRKTIGKLIREIYLFRTCPTSKAFKQFYFVEFISVNTAIISRNG